MADATQTILEVLHRNLQSIWDGDVETYRATTAGDVSFFEWYISSRQLPRPRAWRFCATDVLIRVSSARSSEWGRDVALSLPGL